MSHWFRRRSRAKIIRIINAMATELEARAAQLDPSAGPAWQINGVGYRRAARHLREALSIAQGRRSAAYWSRLAGQRAKPIACASRSS